jgi:iron-sulfur cluster assembly protein
MIEISDGAARRIRALMAKDGIAPGGGLRVGVKAGGCSGLSYVFSWETAPRPDDRVFEGPQGTAIVVDPKSLRFLDGTVLDCDTGMLGQSLLFKNPNAKSTCGCGTSFSV